MQADIALYTVISFGTIIKKLNVEKVIVWSKNKCVKFKSCPIACLRITPQDINFFLKRFFWPVNHWQVNFHCHPGYLNVTQIFKQPPRLNDVSLVDKRRF